MTRKCLIVAAVCAAAGCSLAPDYGEPGRERLYRCYMPLEYAEYAIVFSDRSARVVFLDEEIDLAFVPQSIFSGLGFLREDLYRGEGYTLTLDPQAHLTTPDGIRYGPCD